MSHSPFDEGYTKRPSHCMMHANTFTSPSQTLIHYEFVKSTMLVSTTRSRLAGLASKSFLHARTISASPNLSIGHNKLAQAFYGDTPTVRSPEIVTAEGLRKVNKFVADRAAASLKDKTAYNCSLECTQKSLNELPIVEGQSM